jgi:hypothetical protein
VEWRFLVLLRVAISPNALTHSLDVSAGLTWDMATGTYDAMFVVQQSHGFRSVLSGTVILQKAQCSRVVPHSEEVVSCEPLGVLWRFEVCCRCQVRNLDQTCIMFKTLGKDRLGVASRATVEAMTYYTNLITESAKSSE